MKSVTAGSLTIGHGMPKIFVPVMAKTREEVLAAVKKAAASAADALEFRADACDCLTDAEALVSLISEIRGIIGVMPLLLTIRTRREGGLADLTDEAYRQLLLALIERGGFELLDAEEARCGDAVPAAAKEKGIAVVMSYHDFQATPSAEIITERLCRMEARGAAIAKIAVMPLAQADVAAILESAAESRRRLNIPHLIIGMGGIGLVTRLAGEALGFCLTFASCGEASAPGQIDSRLMRRYLAGIHHIRQTDRLIYLTGFMGSGKSTIARQLGLLTGQIVYELDDMIEEEAGAAIREIFAAEGEEGFRRREHGMLKRLSREKGGIVSTGGGVPMRAENVRLMTYSGRTVYLRAQPGTIREHLKDQIAVRPMLQGDDSGRRITELMALRRAAYEGAADHIIDIDEKSIEEIALELILVVENEDEMV